MIKLKQIQIIPSSPNGWFDVIIGTKEIGSIRKVETGFKINIDKEFDFYKTNGSTYIDLSECSHEFYKNIIAYVKTFIET